MKWYPLANSVCRFAQLPGWLLQLTHDGDRTLAVWTNGRSVYTVLAGQA